MGTPYFVPVHKASRALALSTGRLISGERIGLAFTSEAGLLLTLGPSQEWIRLDGEALRDMLTPLGITEIRIDPHPATPEQQSMPEQQPVQCGQVPDSRSPDIALAPLRAVG